MAKLIESRQIVAHHYWGPTHIQCKMCAKVLQEKYEEQQTFYV